jgi:peptidoglycan/LPS O-acetylase OafA/YrhL
MRVGADKGIRKYEYIDAMRGIAILMVILVHCSQSVAWQGSVSLVDRFSVTLSSLGQLGVQLFFVASGLTLSLSMDSRGWESKAVGAFFIRRFFRIAPMYYIGMAFFAALSAIGKFWSISHYTLINVAANLFFVHGLVPSANNSIVPGGWSIGTECLFYAVFPLLFIFYKKKGIRSLCYLLIAYAAILGIAGILARKYLGMMVENNTFAYFNFLVQLPVFVLGTACFHLVKYEDSRISTRLAVAVCVLALAAGCCLWWAGCFLFVPLVFGLAFVFLGLAMSRLQMIPQILTSIGRNSYSMYVFHILFAWVIGKRLNTWFLHSCNHTIALLLTFAVAVTFSYLFAKVTYRYVEKTFINIGTGIIKNRIYGVSDVAEQKDRVRV